MQQQQQQQQQQLLRPPIAIHASNPLHTPPYPPRTPAPYMVSALTASSIPTSSHLSANSLLPPHAAFARRPSSFDWPAMPVPRVEVPVSTLTHDEDDVDDVDVDAEITSKPKAPKSKSIAMAVNGDLL